MSTITKRELEAELIETSEKLVQAEKEIESLKTQEKENLSAKNDLDWQVLHFRTKSEKLADELDRTKEERDHFRDLVAFEEKSESENNALPWVLGSVFIAGIFALTLIWIGTREKLAPFEFPETIRTEVFLHHVTPPQPEPEPVPEPTPEPEPEPEIPIGDWMNRELEKYNPTSDDKKKVKAVIDDTIQHIRHYPNASEGNVTTKIKYLVGWHRVPSRLHPFFIDFGSELKRRVDGGETVQSLIEQLQ